MPTTTLANLPPFDPATGKLNVVIETPKGCRNKYNFNAELGLFTLKKVLPAGAVFPFDFGFVPSTLGGDGDPLDVLLLMDEPAFPGCLIRANLLGIIEANQTKEGKTVRNDRLIAMVENAAQPCVVKSMAQLGKDLVAQIEHFFISYNSIVGKKFKPLRRLGVAAAVREVKRAHQRCKAEPSPSNS